MAQEIRKHKKRPPKRMEEQPSPFSGMVYCADCGAVMRMTRRRSEEIGNSLKCSTYSKRGTEGCTAHYIHERQLEAIVLDDLRSVNYARQKERLFVEHISRRDAQAAKRDVAHLERAGQAEKAGSRTNNLVQAALRGQCAGTHSK